MLKKRYNFSEVEKKWQDFWQENEIYRFIPSSNRPVFSIDTPPPTVNGKIHIGHIFSYSQAEIIARYMRLKGYNVFYPFGFDDNGLPTERLVEKLHGMKARETTRQNFTDWCLHETAKLEEEFKKLFISAGFSCDWNCQYSTISPKAQAISQRSFIELYNQGKVHFSEAPALWCTECQTAVAQAELETQEKPSTFNFLKFYIDGSDQFIEIATTRPELLPACQCVFIHPDDEKHRDLLGKSVRVPLFDLVVPVLQDEKVDMTKGSGIVMCCTFGDLTDLEWYKKYSMTFAEAILPDGTMSKLCGKYSGLSVAEARKAILGDLDSNGYLLKQEKLSHNVAVHERCGSAIEITIKKQWFIDLLADKQKFIDAGNQINWFPAHMKTRYQNWVENIEWDWCISRQRFFGVPFPVWYCKNCGKVMIADISRLPVDPLKDTPTQKCCCGCEDFSPEEDIMDTWATSSMTPFINLDWQHSEEFKSNLLPMSLRPNGHDIIRTWDFYTIVKSLYHTNRIPWHNVMISGHVMASKGEKISKKKSNSSMEPADIISHYSADALRLWASTGSLGSDIVFSEEEFRNATKLINKIWNAARFIISHLEGFERRNDNGEVIIFHPFSKSDQIKLLYFDRWIINSFNKMLNRFESYLEKYEIGLALGELEKFFWSYCDDYIEIVKNRLYKIDIYEEKYRKSGLYACYYTFLGILKCFSIYIPHVCEEIFQGYFVNEEHDISIHCSTLQKIKSVSWSEDEEKCEKYVLDIISQVRKYRSINNLSLKSELSKVLIEIPDRFILPQDVLDDIKATCVCNDIEIQDSQSFSVKIIG